MVFNSVVFLFCFLPLALLAYYLCLLYTSDAADEL